MRSRWRGVAAVAVFVTACASDPEATPAPATAGPTAEAEASSPGLTPAPAPTPRATPADTAGGVYLALGDSITFGIGAPEPSRQGYPALLTRHLRGADDALVRELRVFAVPGETAAGFLANRIDDVEDAIAELGDRVELVTVGLGANELLRIRRDAACREDRASAQCQAIAALAAEEAADALDGVVTRVQLALEAAGAEATILLLAYYNPDVEPIAVATIVGHDGVVACVADDPVPGLNDRIACVAERRGVGLVDLYVAFLGREDELTGIGAGEVHPNQEGYEVIAAAIAEELALPEDPG